jgi:hypothetical protein
MTRLFIEVFALLLAMIASGGVGKHGRPIVSCVYVTSLTFSFTSGYSFASNAKNHRQRYHSTLFASNSWYNPTPHKRHHQQQRRHYVNPKIKSRWMKSLRGGSLHSSSSSPTTTTTTTIAPQPEGTTLFASTSSQNVPQKSLSDWAQESIAIAGTTTPEDSLHSFGGLRYRDSSAERESFRVIFVLGGPGREECYRNLVSLLLHLFFIIHSFSFH